METSRKRLSPTIRKLLNKLKEDELVEVQRFVWEKLKSLHKNRIKYQLRKFQMLDQVCFFNKGKKQMGIITRLNPKTITVTLDNGERWNVSPMLLRKVKGQKNLLKALLENKG